MKNLVAIDQQTFEEFVNEFKAFKKEVQSKKEAPSAKWIDNVQFCKLLNIGTRTAQNYRDNGVIPFSTPTPNGKVYYKLEDVEALMNAAYTGKKK